MIGATVVGAIVIGLGVLPTVAMWAVASLLRVPLSQVNFFVGPAVLSAGVEPRFAVRLFPIGGSLKFVMEAVPGAYPGRHPLLRAFAHLAPLVLLSGVSAALLGWRQTGEAIQAGWGQLLEGSLSGTEAQRLVLSLAELPLSLAVGVVTAKCVAVNLLPLPILPAGLACVELLRWRRPTEWMPTLLDQLAVASAVLMILCCLLWTRAAISAIVWGAP